MGGVEYEDIDSEHGYTDEETMDDSEHEEHNHSDNENIDNENEDTDSEHGDTDDESDDESNTDEQMDDEIFISDDEDEDVDNDNKFHLLHIINDTRSIFEYCIKMRKEYRKALKQFNNLNEEDTRSVIKSYAKLEVIVKDDKFGIENDNNNNNNNESDDDFWDLSWWDIYISVDIDEAVQLFTNKILSILDLMAPIKTFQTSSKYCPGLSD